MKKNDMPTISYSEIVDFFAWPELVVTGGLVSSHDWLGEINKRKNSRGTSGTSRGEKQKEVTRQISRIFFSRDWPTGHDEWTSGTSREKQNEMKRQNFRIFILVWLVGLVMTGGTSCGTISEKMICQQF